MKLLIKEAPDSFGYWSDEEIAQHKAERDKFYSDKADKFLNTDAEQFNERVYELITTPFIDKPPYQEYFKSLGFEVYNDVQNDSAYKWKDIFNINDVQYNYNDNGKIKKVLTPEWEKYLKSHSLRDVIDNIVKTNGNQEFDFDIGDDYLYTVKEILGDFYWEEDDIYYWWRLRGHDLIVYNVDNSGFAVKNIKTGALSGDFGANRIYDTCINLSDLSNFSKDTKKSNNPNEITIETNNGPEQGVIIGSYEAKKYSGSETYLDEVKLNNGKTVWVEYDGWEYNQVNKSNYKIYDEEGNQIW